MSYYSPQEATLIVTQVWKVHVAARRYFNKAMEEVKSKLKPDNRCFWKASGKNYNGYQADLAFFSIEEPLDSWKDALYPDW